MRGMKFVCGLTIVLLGLALCPIAAAQDCGHVTNYDLRGTYTMSGSGFIDLSKLLAGIPGLPPMPVGLVPFSWVGAHTYNETGGGTGWVSMNAAGNQLNATFVGLKYSIGANCRVEASFSLQIAELGGAVVGPISRVLVPVFRPAPDWWAPAQVELHMIVEGPAPGTPGAGLDNGVAYRISTTY